MISAVSTQMFSRTNSSTARHFRSAKISMTGEAAEKFDAGQQPLLSYHHAGKVASAMSLTPAAINCQRSA
jgi:hypothetical protein